jgi:hypothetical protein
MYEPHMHAFSSQVSRGYTDQQNSQPVNALRMRVERTLAWEDKCKRRLLRFERIQQRHYGMKLSSTQKI